MPNKNEENYTPVPIETPVCGCIGWRAVDEKMLI